MFMLAVRVKNLDHMQGILTQQSYAVVNGANWTNVVTEIEQLKQTGHTDLMQCGHLKASPYFTQTQRWMPI